ncbi:TBC1 domain family member 14-like [Dreissena polymorpha]|nr:TBC1 domain family member 14-like [Dreissena polymorpha]
MCEESHIKPMSGMLHNEDADIMIVKVFDNNEDAEELKSKLKDMTVNGNATSSFESDTNDNHDEKQRKTPSRSVSGSDEFLCLSTETLIDNPDGHDLSAIHNVSEVMQYYQKTRDGSGQGSNNNSPSQNKVVTTSMTKVSSGLLISPNSLAGEVHIDTSENKQRMSAVLESLDLQLFYIPTTQQLVATKKTDSTHTKLHATQSDNVLARTTKLDDCETDSSGYASGKSNSLERPGSGSPIKMATSDSSPVHSISEFLSSKSSFKDDTSSLNESDCLIKIHEAANSTIDNSEFMCAFPRINTNESLLRTFNDASSLSSLSTGTDFSISAASLDDYYDGTGHCIDTGDGGFMEVNLHTRNSFERGKNASQDSGIEDKSLKPKRRGLTGLLSRGLFSRKPKEGSDDEQPGWKLFGKIPPKHGAAKHPGQIQSEYKEEQQASSRSKKEDIEVMSTTALILENRPMNLPSKSPEELEKHQKQYEAMVDAARRKERQELKRRKRQLQQQLRQEEQLLADAKIWTKDILPNWDAMKHSKKARDLWWHGIPTNLRGKVWKLALGNDLNITTELYEICVSRAADKIKQMDETPVVFRPAELASASKESSVELIKLDVSRTFPQLCIFQKGGPYHDLLHSLLGAYACYRPDVGYVQGMSFIAAVLLLNMEVGDAFVCFANLLNRPCQVAFFRVDEGLMKAYFVTYEEFFIENMPNLASHFKKNNLTPDIYLYDWIFTLFSKSLPLELACRVWDIFCRDGEEFLFRTALGILKSYEEVLLQMDFILLAQFLTRLPEGERYEAKLFRSIEAIQMNVDKKKFSQVLAGNKEPTDHS